MVSSGFVQKFNKESHSKVCYKKEKYKLNVMNHV